MVIEVTDPRGLNLVESQLWNEENWSSKYIGVLPCISGSMEELRGVGTAASVQEMRAWSHPAPRFSLVLAGLCRFRVEEVRRELPFPVARVSQLDCRPQEGERLPGQAQSLVEEYRASALELVDLLNLNTSSHSRLKVPLAHPHIQHTLTSSTPSQPQHLLTQQTQAAAVISTRPLSP
jgi:Lon protease-like protein